jgi:hypothetical protein
VFAACLEAIDFSYDLNPRDVLMIPNLKRFRAATTPRMFEISRDGPYELRTSACPTPGDSINPPFEESAPASYVLKMSAWVVPMGLLALWLLVPAVPFLRRLTVTHSDPPKPSAAPIPSVGVEQAETPETAEEVSASAMNEEEGARRAIRMAAAPALEQLRGCERADRNSAIIVIAAFILLSAVFYVVVRTDFEQGGKPSSFLTGISLWPTEYIRLVAAFISILFLCRARAALRHSDYELSQIYGLPGPDEAVPMPPRQTAPHVSLSEWIRQRLSLTAMQWENRCARRRKEENILPGELRRSCGTVAQVWSEYMRLGLSRIRLWRVIPLSLVFLFLAGLAQWSLGPPFRPFRGATSNGLDLVVMMISGMAVVVMTFSMVDAIRLCEVFCSNLAGRLIEWDEANKKRFAEERNMEPSDVSEWLDIEFIAERTRVIGRFILYPFAALALMIFSRARTFDRWDWPIPLIVVFGVLCVYAIWCVIMLRRSAERARTDAIEEMKRRRLKLLKDTDERAKSRAAQLEMAIAAVQENQKGAFAPMTKNPLVGALLIPATGAGAILLIEFLTNPH